MKKLMPFRILTIILLATITIISCSKDGNSETDYSLSQQKSSTQTEYEKIITSPEYVEWQNSINDINSYLPESIEVSLSTRAEFESWMDKNMNLTTFNSFDDAMILYDKLYDSSVAMDNQFGSFYLGLTNLQGVEILPIIQPGLATPPTLPADATPCQNACMDTCTFRLDTSAKAHAITLSKKGLSHMERTQSQAAYQKTVNWIIKDFNACMGLCE